MDTQSETMWRKFIATYGTYEENETDRYVVSEERRKIVGRIHYQAKQIFGPAKDLTVFTDAILTHNEAQYLAVDFRGPNGGVTNGSRMKAWHVEIREPEPGKGYFAYDLLSRKTLGYVSQGSWRFNWGKVLYSALMEGAQQPMPLWEAHRLFVLPLDGAVVDRHEMAKRLRDLAKYLMGGNATGDTLQHVWSLDQQQDELAAKEKLLEDEIKALPAHTFTLEECAAINEANGALIKLLQSHAWTYEYSDMHIVASAKQAQEIGGMLYALPLTTALAVFLMNVPIYWSYARHFLARHPEVMAIEAAAKVNS